VRAPFFKEGLEQPTDMGIVHELIERGFGWFRAMRKSLQHRRQLKILKLIGKVDYFPTYDYKSIRRKR
jgi:hypothetical protein